MSTENLSLQQRIYNAASNQQVEKLHGIHNYLHAKAFQAEEFSTIWSHSAEASWGHSFGRMRGFDEIWYDSVTIYDALAYENYLSLYDIFPEIGGRDPRPMMELSMHTLVNGVIEVAEDGKSARASFITPGILYDRVNREMVKRCMNFWERYGSDFVCEDGTWLYLHEQVCPDFGMPLDVGNAAASSYQQLANPPKGPRPPRPAGRKEMILLADPNPPHTMYSITTPIQNTVPCPEPYATMDEKNSFVPPIAKAPFMKEK